jgi:hypothetical protein
MNIQDNLNSAKDTLSQGLTSVAESVSNATRSVSQSLNDFSSNASVSADEGFLQSNGIIAKFVFLIMVVILFVLLFKLGIYLISYFIAPTSSPYIVDGMIPGNQALFVSQINNGSNYTPILRSDNQPTGLEFTWSVWLQINTLLASNQKYQPVFVKGDANYNNINISTTNNAPGVYIAPISTIGSRVEGSLADDSNGELDKASGYFGQLHILMDTIVAPGSDKDATSQVIDVANVPLKKWFNLMIRAENKYVDVYINGTIFKRSNLTYPLKQNFNDVHICENGGFGGNLSNLRYFNKALDIGEINSIVADGPKTSPSSLLSGGGTMSNYSYLSSSWYSNI